MVDNLTEHSPYWKRSRHRELDPLRTFDVSFNSGWIMFFGTCPPGCVPSILTDKGSVLAGQVQTPVVEVPEPESVEPYNRRIHNGRVLD